jgi:phosphopantothenoylcysteine decarboxylase/phosphopantothenate--cysteine ligase
VAALKTPSLIRRLLEAGHEVKAVASDDAYHFVTELSLAVASGGEVFDRKAWFRADGRARHLELARWAEVLVIAPATADALASAATGRADDVVSALVVSGVARVVWVPAMNTAMWQHPLVQRNVEVLRGLGHAFLGPEEGPLGTRGEGEGVGRMLEPELVVAGLADALRPKDLAGRRLLVSAGPTREYLDPVRFISNPSSGKMGFAVARAALSRGAEVTLVSGPTALTPPMEAELIRVESAEEMLDALSVQLEAADALVMTAAVADWRAAQIKRDKESKVGERQVLELIRTPDILETLAPRKGERVFVGFAMETSAGVERAREKARRKKLDFICLNYPTREGTAFGGDENEVTLVAPEGEAEALPRMGKLELAHLILDRIAARWQASRGLV